VFNILLQVLDDGRITDSQGRKGIDLGLRADFINNGLNLSLSPNNPIIAYRRFNVNDENFIFLGKNKDIKADMNLLADDGTALSIYSTPADSVNDITLSINNLNLGELSNVMPYLPKLEGMLSGDMHVMDDHQNGSLSAAAQFKAKSLVFEDAQLGNVGMEAFYMPQGNGKHYANAYVSTDTLEVLQCEGTYDDNDGSFDGVANLHDCPLRLINGFLVGAFTLQLFGGLWFRLPDGPHAGGNPCESDELEKLCPALCEERKPAFAQRHARHAQLLAHRSQFLNAGQQFRAHQRQAKQSVAALWKGLCQLSRNAQGNV